MESRIKAYYVQLADGRELGVSDSGPPDGKPILFFPGFGVSASAAHPDSTVAESVGVRLISVDRPGIGKSSPQPKRTLLDWPRDVAALADRLGFERFGVLGWSSGGPHALACAKQIATRVAVVGLFACAPPFSGEARIIAAMPADARRLASVAKYATPLLRLGLWNHCRQIRKDPDAFLFRSAQDLGDSDRDAIFDIRYHASLKLSMIEACEQGPQGLIDDVLAIVRPWGFGLSEVAARVDLWHAEEDKTIPVQVGRYIANAIKDCSATFLPAGGHFSYLTHWREILRTLAASM